MADHDNADMSKQRRSHQQTTVKVTEEARKLLAGSKKGERDVFVFVGKCVCVFGFVCCCRVRGENKQKKAQLSGLGDSEQRTLWTSNSSLQVHPLLCVCVIRRATDGTVSLCVWERREGDRKCAGPAILIETVCSSLFLHPAISPLLFLLSVASISEAAGAARREQVAAFKVVKTTESRRKRAGREKCVCVWKCGRDRKRSLRIKSKRRKGRDRQGDAGNRWRHTCVSPEPQHSMTEIPEGAETEWQRQEESNRPL